MSRIGKRPVPIPDGVTVAYADSEVKVKGPRGSLVTALPDGIQVEVADGEIRLSRPDDRRQYRSLHGLARALTANMVTGVTEGFSKALEIQGVGYRAEVKGKVSAIEGVSDARGDLVWDPPWSKDRMSEAAKLQLGIFD